MWPTTVVFARSRRRRVRTEISRDILAAIASRKVWLQAGSSKPSPDRYPEESVISVFVLLGGQLGPLLELGARGLAISRCRTDHNVPKTCACTVPDRTRRSRLLAAKLPLETKAQSISLADAS